MRPARTILLTGIAFSLQISGTQGSAMGIPEQNGMNVLFIAIEDFNPEHLGCYGGQAITPNIDRLAGEAVLFRHAFCDVPVCNPSRTALLTGLRPPASGVFGNADNWQEMALPKIGSTLPAHFKHHGYDAVKVGKIFHYQMEHPASWSRELPARVEGRKLLSSWNKSEVIPLLNELEEDPGEEWFNEHLHWGPVDCRPGEFRDGHYADNVVDFLAEDHDRPFFLAVGFHAPHVKFAAPREFFDLYKAADIMLPDNPPNDLEDIPSGPSKNPIHDVLDSALWREIKRAQFACISYVDWCIGKVLDAVRENNLENNTAIVIWTDHGFLLGEHFQWAKGNKLFSETNQVGLIWKVPGVTPEGVISGSIVESIDIFPTLFDLCHIDPPDHVQGESLVRLLENPSLTLKNAAFTWGSRDRVSVQTERYRLNMDRDLHPSSFELYDHRYDPDEYINVSCNPQYRDILGKLVSHYRDHLRKYGLSSCF